jgi:probable sporulation protein (polysaccharide deacetylase family)
VRIGYLSNQRIKTFFIISIIAIVAIMGCLYYFNNLHLDRAVNGAIFQGNTGQKNVTINVNVDWGEEFIPTMLEILAQENINVNFFVTGTWAEKNPELVKTMFKGNHNIENHGYKHCHFNQLSSAQSIEEINKAEKIITDLVGKKPNYFASPYGEYDKHIVEAAQSINYKFIMWSVDTVDWKKPAPETIINRVVKRLHNDAIILMHPTEPTVKALPELIKKIKAEGYNIVKIEEIIVDNNQDNENHV